MICKNCGFTNAQDARSCAHCGMPLISSNQLISKAPSRPRMAPLDPQNNPAGENAPGDNNSYNSNRRAPNIEANIPPAGQQPPQQNSNSSAPMRRSGPIHPSAPNNISTQRSNAGYPFTTPTQQTPTPQQFVRPPSQPQHRSGPVYPASQPASEPNNRLPAPYRPNMPNIPNVSNNPGSPSFGASSMQPSRQFRSMQQGQSGQWDLFEDVSSLSGQWNMQQFRNTGFGEGSVIRNGLIRVLGVYEPIRKITTSSTVQRWMAVDMSRGGDRIILARIPLNDMNAIEADFSREMISNKLRDISEHPNVQKYIDSFIDQQAIYFVFEAIEGRWLSDRVEELGTISEQAAKKLLGQVLDVCEFLENQRPSVPHGEISPDSLLLSENEEKIYVCNWSIPLLAQTLNVKLPSKPALIKNFSPPEAEADEPKIANDLYAAAASFYYAMTNASMSVYRSGLFQPLHQLNPAVSASMDRFINKSLRVSPAQRYIDTEDMRIALEKTDHRPQKKVKDAQSSAGGMSIIITTIVSLIIITTLITGLIIHSQFSSSFIAATPQPSPTVNPTAVALTQEGLGISEGQTAFYISDTSVYKLTPQQIVAQASSGTAIPAAAVAEAQTMIGAQYYAKGDYANAVIYFADATKTDPSNPEAAIYLANAQIMAGSHTNFITLAVASSFSGQDLPSTLQILRGISIAQNEINSSDVYPGKVKIAIASVGSDGAGAVPVASYLVNMVQNGNADHVVGVITWAPNNLNANSAVLIQQAANILTSAQIPIIAPESVTDSIGGTPYFYTITASVADQMTAMAQFILQKFRPFSIELAVDPSNARNQEAAFIMSKVLSSIPNGPNVHTDNISLQSSASFITAAKDTGIYGSGAVIVIGSDQDTIAMNKALISFGLNTPILAGPMADSPALLGQGSSAMAQYALQHASQMSNIYTLSLADPSVWSYLNQQPPQFFQKFYATFSTQTNVINADQNAILSYDSMYLITTSLVNSNGWTNKIIPSAQSLRDSLDNVTPSQPFNGISGVIAFDSQGTIVHRAMEILNLQVSQNSVNSSGQHNLVWQIVSIVNGANAICATSAQQNSCAPI